MSRRIILKAFLYILIIAIALANTGCGGGGGASTSSASSPKTITEFTLNGTVAPSLIRVTVTGTINETNKTIAVTMPYGTNISALVATLTTTGSSVKVGAATQISGSSANDFSNPVTYTATAADGTTASYTVTVTVALNSAKAITAFSLAGVAGTINETNKTIAVTLPFGTNVSPLVATFSTTGSSVKVGVSTEISGSNTIDFINPRTFTVTAADGTTASYVVTVSVAPNLAKAITAFSLAGIAGTINEANKTVAVTMPYGTNITSLVATFIGTGTSVKAGATTQISGSSANDFTNPVTYTVTAADGTTASYVVTVTVALSSAKAITAFSLAGIVGAINETNKTVTVIMPFGTNITALTATFSTSGTGVKVGVASQISGSTIMDFTSPVTYTVTAANGTTVSYVVAVTTVALSSAKAISAFSLAGVAGTVDETNRTIAVNMPYGTNVTTLVATFTATGASIKVGAATQTSSTTANDFTIPVMYMVTAADGTTASYLVTVVVDTIVIQISAGYLNTAAIKSDGGLWSWGGNYCGSLGDGSATGVSNVPIQIGTGFSSVVVGWEHKLALKTDGSLWVWGCNSYGQLGDGVITNSLVPKQIGAGYVAIAANMRSSFAIKSDGSLWAWGYNAGGQLGDGTVNSSLVPVQVGTNFASVYTSGYTTMGIKSDGSLWAWGSGMSGMLGNGATIDSLVPIQVGTGFTKLALGNFSTVVALKADGSLWAWGRNSFGQLGDGTTTDSLIPKQIGIGFIQIAEGMEYTVALKSDGGLWAWGRNQFGALGDGTITTSLVPKLIDSGYTSISTNGYNTFGIKNDGSLWAWGWNLGGQLGDGTTADKIIPTRVQVQ